MPLSVPRRLVGDLLHFAHKIPTVPVQRRMQLARVVAARQACNPRPGWVALFAKAYSLVAAEMPGLRRSYLGFPAPRLFECDESVASIAVERDYDGEPAVFFGRVDAPDRLPLDVLDARLRGFKTRPIDDVGAFRQAVRVTRLWRPLRRLAWWYGLNVSGRQRAKRFGTFGLSVYSGLGVESLHPLSPLTTCLNYGVIGPAGDVDVRIIYDHRVLDGATVGRALVRLEESLTGPIVAELERLARAPSAAA
jgi:hypothetical protein